MNPMQSDALLPWRLWQRSAIRVSDGLEGLVFSVNETWTPWTDALLPTVSNQAPAFFRLSAMRSPIVLAS